GSLSAALWGLRRGPGMLGLVAEDRLHLGALEGPVASCDLRLELTRCPAGVADEDPQTVHGIVAAKQLEQQLPVRAQVDSVTGLARALGRCGGAKQEPHGPEVNGSAEVHLVAPLPEALAIGAATGDTYRHRPVLAVLPLVHARFLRIAIHSSGEAWERRGYFFRRALAADRVGQVISPRATLALISINSRRIGTDHFWRMAGMSRP